MKSWAIALSVIFASVWAATSALAEQITVTAMGTTSLGVSGMTITEDDINSSTTYAGLYSWKVTSPGDTGTTFPISAYPIGSSFNAFCIQMGQNFTGGSTFAFDVSSINNANPQGGNDAGFIDSTAAGQIQLLTDQYFGLIIPSGFEAITGAPAPHTTGPDAGKYSAASIAAAFQLSLWEIEYDGGLGKNTAATNGPEGYPSSNYFSTGNFKASGGGNSGTDAINLATYFLDNFTVGTLGVDTAYSSKALTQGSKQDQFWGIPGAVPHTPTVPLPAALPAGLTLLVGLGAFRKIRAKMRG